MDSTPTPGAIIKDEMGKLVEGDHASGGVGVDADFVHEAAQELLPLLQSAFLQHLAESPQVGERFARGGLQVDGLIVDPRQVRKASFQLLLAGPDLRQAFVQQRVGRCYRKERQA